MIKLVDKYILQHFLSKVLLTLITFIIIFLLVDVIDHLDKIIDSNMPNIEIIKYYYYTIPWYLSLGLPMSLLLSTVFIFGILQKNFELSALKASGISIRRLSSSLIIIGFFFSIFSFFFDNIYVSDSLQKRNELAIKYNLKHSKNKKIKKKNIFRQETKNQILGIRRYQFKNEIAHNVSIQKFLKGKLLYRIDAPIMQWNSEKNHWKIPHYYTRNWNSNSIFFKESIQDTIMKLNFTPIDLTQATVKPEEMNYWELKEFVKKLELHGVKDPRWAVNMYFKASFACTSFLMIIFGLSLSIRKPRSNLAVGIGISIFVIFIYYATLKIGQSLGYNGTLDPITSVWLPNIIFLIIGIFLLKNTQT